MGQTPGQYYQQQAYPVAAPQPTNGLGVAGFIVSLVGFFFGCLLCPVGLLLSFIALFKRPRGFAIAGFILGLIGSIIPALILAFFGVIIFSAVALGKPGVVTMFTIEEAHQKVDRAAIMGLDGGAGREVYRETLLAGMRDGWGNPLRYQRSGAGYAIRSAGPDGTFETPDDLTQEYREPSAVKPE